MTSMAPASTSMSEIVAITFDSPESDIIDMAAEILREGGLVVAPTETRYGLLARADRPDTLTRLYEVKERPATMPTAVFVENLADIGKLARETDLSRLISRRFLPGPLTLVLEAVCDWQEPLVVDNRIGLRLSPALPITSLLARVDFPLTATSANLSGHGDVEEVGDAAAVFGDRVDFYLDSGRLDSLPSTVVDCSGDEPVVLREGVITSRQLKAAIEERR